MSGEGSGPNSLEASAGLRRMPLITAPLASPAGVAVLLPLSDGVIDNQETLPPERWRPNYRHLSRGRSDAVPR